MSVYKIFFVLFTDSIINKILVWTNVKINYVREKYKQQLRFTKKV